MIKTSAWKAVQFISHLIVRFRISPVQPTEFTERKRYVEYLTNISSYPSGCAFVGTAAHF